MKKALSLALLGALAIGPAMAAGMGEQRSSTDWGGQQQQSRSQSSSLDQNTARQVQQQLQQQGYDVGQVDGVWGPRSQQALSNFQRDQNIEPTGRPDQQTMAALGVDESASQQAQTPSERQRSQGQQQSPDEQRSQEQEGGGLMGR